MSGGTSSTTRLFNCGPAEVNNTFANSYLHRSRCPFRVDVVEDVSCALRPHATQRFWENRHRLLRFNCILQTPYPCLTSSGMTLLRMSFVPCACGVRKCVGALPNAVCGFVWTVWTVWTLQNVASRFWSTKKAHSTRCHQSPSSSAATSHRPMSRLLLIMASQVHHLCLRESLWSRVRALNFPVRFYAKL